MLLRIGIVLGGAGLARLLWQRAEWESWRSALVHFIRD
jgi:hypothetical protein